MDVIGVIFIIWICKPLSSREFISPSFCLTALERFKILASESCDTIISAAGFPFTVPKVEYDDEPNSTQ